MKATWAWSMAVIAGLTAGIPLETRAADLSAQSDTFPRMTAVGAQREPQLKEEEKTACGCRGGFGCSPSYGYGCGIGIGGCGIGIGCGSYGYGGYGCRPRCRPCSPCGGYGYGYGGGCGTICGPTYYGRGYGGGCAPLYGGYGVSPCNYAVPGYDVGGYGIGGCGAGGYGVGGYGVAPAPYYGGVNYFSEADSDADTIPVRNISRRNSRRMQGPEMPRQGQFQGPMQGQDMDDSPYYP